MTVFLTSTVTTEITEMENNRSKGKTTVFLSRLLMFFITIMDPLLVLVSSGPLTGRVAHIRPFTQCYKHKKGPKEDSWIIGSADSQLSSRF